jgi:hypothetical protein
MRPHPSVLAFCLALIASLQADAQDTLADLLADPAISLSRPDDRARIVARMAEIENTRRQNARAKAAAIGLPLRTVQPGGGVLEIADFAGGQPVYRITHNANAAISTGANLLRTSPYSLSGSGVTIGMWDGGSGRASHQEFGSRMVVKDGSAAIDHATHVGGTMIASGVVASARGMAHSAIVDSYDWNSDTSEMTGRGATGPGQADKIYLSNHSYGYISGWNRTGGTSPAYVWYGNGTTTTGYEHDFGRYDSNARDQDALAYSAPYYLIFRSAGNERTDNPSNGQTVQLSPSNTATVSYSTSSHPAGDGTYRGGFETIGFEALSKNVITIGSVTDAVTSGTRDPAKANLSSFTSWGPTDDGRIKPDVVANGDGLYSSLSGSTSSYGTYSGTSMSSPNACGSASLLVQQFGSLFPGQAMRSSTLKGLLIHTADDRGHPGPDYKFGWGLVNVKAAADLVIDHHDYPIKQRIAEDQLSTSITTRTHSFVWDGVSPIRATLCWTDPAGTATSTTTSDQRTAKLVNNLQLKLIAPDGSEFQPFVMPFVGVWTQAAMDLPATTGINNTDNVEQVLVSTPALTGTYQAVVSYSGTLANNLQYYSLLISGSAAEEPQPLPLALNGITPNTGLAGSIVTVDLTGTSLAADTTVTLTKSGQPNITATSVQLIGETLRCQIDLSGAAPGPWSVTATNPKMQSATLPDAFTVIGAIWSENFDGTVSGWASSGSNSWTLTTAQSHSPSKSYFAPGPASKTTTYLTSPSISIPSNGTDLQFKFWHHFNLQNTRDGGQLEFSVDGGTWFGVEASNSGTSFASNGYNTTISNAGGPNGGSEFRGKAAWSGNSGAFIETIVNLTNTAKFAGKTLQARWGLATDSSTSSHGWYVDSMSLTGGGDLSNQPPVVTAAATSSSTETETDADASVWRVERGNFTTLTVAASDDGGEGGLSYTWSASGPAPVFFTPNGDNSAKSTTAEFAQAGDYVASVSISDAQGLSVTSSVNLRVVQTASNLVVSPTVASLSVGGSQLFAALLNDQFGDAMATQPSSFAWSATGGGTISGSGLFTATIAGGPYAVTATSGGFSDFASVTVNPTTASVTLGNLNQTFDGSPKPVTVTTDPAGLTTAVTYDTSPTAPTHAGAYEVEATITDPNYQGTASGTLVIGKATATIELTGLAQTYDGSPKSVTVTTEPAELAANVSVTYDGSVEEPTDAATYAVIATLDHPDYEGSASGSLVISKAPQTIDFAALAVANFGDAPFALNATATSSLAVSYTSSDPAVATVSGDIVTIVGAGETTLTASQAGDANHEAAIDVPQVLTVNKATATVDLTGLTQTYDGSPKPVTAITDPPGLGVSITYDASPEAPTDAGTYAIVATLDDLDYEGSASGSLVISKASQTIDFAALAAANFGDAPFALNATATSSLAVSYTSSDPAVATVSGDTVTIIGAGETTLTASQAGDANHEAAIDVPQVLTVNKATATIDLTGLTQTYDGSPKSVTVTTEPAELEVSITYDSSPDAPMRFESPVWS